MRFEKITINNFRQYRHMEFLFEKTGPFDMHLLIASNGIGKTNLLNSINWCLYGDEPHVSGKNEGFIGEGDLDKLPLANLAAIEACKKAGEESCTVSVEIQATDGSSKYRFMRTASINVNALQQFGKDKYEVVETLSNGTSKVYAPDVAAEVTNLCLPKKIREYFFFDGEQLLNYFGKSKENVSHLRDSVYEIAGVNTINTTEEHLDTFITGYQSELKKLNPELDKYAKAVNDAREAIKTKTDDIEALKRQIDEATTVIEESDKIIKGTESVIENNKKYDNNKKMIEELNERLSKCNDELALFIRKYAVLLMLYKINSDNAEYIEMRQKEDETSPVADINILRNSLEEHKCVVCGSVLNKEAEDFFTAAINKFNSNASVKKLLLIKNDISQATDLTLYIEERDQILNEMSTCMKKKKDLIEENDNLYKIISSVSGKEEIALAMEQKAKNIELKDRNTEIKGKYIEQLKYLNEDLAIKEKEYTKAMENDSKCNEIRQKYEFVMSAKNIVSDVKAGIVSEVTERLEKETLEYFEKLQWKNNTYGAVKLDSNFRLRLYNKDNLPCLDSCAASEKELLALAFVISVDDIAGYSDNLLFIDTPVGRVSDFNRTNFAKFLLEASKSKQIILAFTPSEYKGEIEHILNESVTASIVQLDTNGDETETLVR